MATWRVNQKWLTAWVKIQVIKVTVSLEENEELRSKLEEIQDLIAEALGEEDLEEET